MIISTPTDTPRFEALLGDGSQFGVSLSYKVQPSPDDLAQAFIIGEDFFGDDAYAIILGDNIFYENGFSLSVDEKPKNQKLNYTITGLCFYPAGVSEKAKMVRPSARGELEIIALSDMCLKDDSVGPGAACAAYQKRYSG